MVDTYADGTPHWNDLCEDELTTEHAQALIRSMKPDANDWTSDDLNLMSRANAIYAELRRKELHAISVKVRVFHNGKAEIFDHTMPDSSDVSLTATVDHFEGQVGTVLSIYDADNKRLFKGMVEEWDLR